MQIDVRKKPLLAESIVDVSDTKCQTRAKYLSPVSRVCLSSFFFFFFSSPFLKRCKDGRGGRSHAVSFSICFGHTGIYQVEIM